MINNNNKKIIRKKNNKKKKIFYLLAINSMLTPSSLHFTPVCMHLYKLVLIP